MGTMTATDAATRSSAAAAFRSNGCISEIAAACFGPPTAGDGDRDSLPLQGAALCVIACVMLAISAL